MSYLNVIQKRIDSLIQITIKERKEKGIGMLFIEIKKDEMNCKYISLYEESFPKDIKLNYRDRMINIPSSIIFFCVSTESESSILEIDLDKNSNFHSQVNASQTKNNCSDVTEKICSDECCTKNNSPDECCTKNNSPDVTETNDNSDVNETNDNSDVNETNYS